MGLFTRIFDHEYKELKKFSSQADKIVALDEEMTKLSDDELKHKTEEFKERLANGETLEDMLIEAFAVAREAAYRVIGEKPFYVQVLGALAIHYGNIAEMKTGEGKTLTCVMPAYLNALEGKGVHIITVNEYLATRDAEWMGGIHRFLGLTVGVNTRDMSPKEKQEAYNCDILYSTNNEVGFDYLRDNMVIRKENRVQRPLNFAIVDEVDSILIDEARTPLIISGGASHSENLYLDADKFAKSLKEDTDYICDETKIPDSSAFIKELIRKHMEEEQGLTKPVETAPSNEDIMKSMFTEFQNTMSQLLEQNNRMNRELLEKQFSNITIVANTQTNECEELAPCIIKTEVDEIDEENARLYEDFEL